jgi:hypothetical protein
VPTLRLKFAYEDGSVRLLSRQKVDMVVPASEPTEAEGARAGFWFELRDAGGRTLYRRTMQDPTDPTVEVRSGDPERPFMRVPAGALRREFVVLVPEIGERPNLVFFGRPVPPGGVAPVPGPSQAASKEIARFDLR